MVLSGLWCRVGEGEARRGAPPYDGQWAVLLGFAPRQLDGDPPTPPAPGASTSPPASRNGEPPGEPADLGDHELPACRHLPVTPLDAGILHLDSGLEPWSVHLEVRLAGSVDGARLRHAVAVAVGRHRRARARLVVPHRRPRRYRWEIADELDVDPVDEVVCGDDDDLEAARSELQSEPIPLVLSPPLRMRLAHHPAGDAVMVNLHHAAADGMAAVRLVRSVTAAYARRPDPVPSLSADELTMPSGGGWRRVRAVLEELRGTARRHTHLVPDGGDDERGYRFRQMPSPPPRPTPSEAPPREVSSSPGRSDRCRGHG